MQQLPGCRALLPSSGLTKINIPCLSAWPSTSAFPDLVPVTLSRLFWNVVTSHFCKTTSDHLLHVILSNRTAGRPRPGCNPSKLLTESLLGMNISPEPGRHQLHLWEPLRNGLCFYFTLKVEHWSHFMGGCKYLSFSYFVCVSLFFYCCFYHLISFGAFCNDFVQLIPSGWHI